MDAYDRLHAVSRLKRRPLADAILHALLYQQDEQA